MRRSINGMGSYLPHMQELPESIIQAADKVFFDSKEGVLAEAGDFIIPLKRNVFVETDFDGDLGQMILGKVKGRESEQDITLFKSVGTAVLDLVTAFKIYKKAIDFKAGKKIVF